MRGRSGWGWNHQTLLPNIPHDVWETYITVSLLHFFIYLFKLSNAPSIQSHPKAKPYRTKPFPLFDDMAELVGLTRATGHGSYRAGETPEPDNGYAAALFGSPENDLAPGFPESPDAHTATPSPSILRYKMRAPSYQA